jgi:drug/metabolite transporter (DMT)-like permease
MAVAVLVAAVAVLVAAVAVLVVAVAVLVVAVAVLVVAAQVVRGVLPTPAHAELQDPPIPRQCEAGQSSWASAMNPSLRQLLVIAFLLQLIWGMVPTASKMVIDEIPIELYIAIRWSISGLIFAVYLGLSKTWQRVSTADTCAVAGLGVMGYAVASLGTLYGLKLGGVTQFALMAAFAPAVTTFVSIWILKERPGRWFYVALPLSTLGLGFLVTGKVADESWITVAQSFACIMGGLLLEAFVFVFSKKFKSKMSSLQYLAIAQLAAAAVMWIFQAIRLHQISALADLKTDGWAAAIFVSCVACVLCYAVLYWLLLRVEGHKLSLFDGVHAISATACGILFLGETLTGKMAVGGVLILLGLILGNYPSAPVEKQIE